MKDKRDLVKLSKQHIRVNGGYSLLAAYRGNVKSALQSAFPGLFHFFCSSLFRN